MRTQTLLGALALFLTTLCASSAFALEPAATVGKPSAQLGLRYGTDNLDLGFGARGGYTIDPGIYVGALFDYYLGETTETAAGDFGYSFWMLMAEAGYDVGVHPSVVLRPLVTLGMVAVSIDCPDAAGTFCSDGESDFDFGIGGEGMYLIDNILIGAGIRYLFDGSVAIFDANIGMTF